MKHTVMERWDPDAMADFFKILGDKTRLRILMELLSGSLCVMHISERVGMSQSATSHQLAILRRADLVRVTRKGKTLVYAISDEHVRLLLDMAILHLGEEKE
ncbi:MAG: winged helix-turn-helix transcriptional regulator [Clostridia bacterium]|nr:winged helix-turn-helix transcriptional regulator [Clostridia bacterium]